MWMISAIAILLPSVAMAFEPPSEKTIREAIGDLSGLPVVLQRAFAPDGNSFDPIPKPEPNDWLAVHKEPGQTFDEFKASGSNRPARDRHVITSSRSAILRPSAVRQLTNCASLPPRFLQWK
jgi:hypothetical protein